MIGWYFWVCSMKISDLFFEILGNLKKFFSDSQILVFRRPLIIKNLNNEDNPSVKNGLALTLSRPILRLIQTSYIFYASHVWMNIQLFLENLKKYNFLSAYLVRPCSCCSLFKYQPPSFTNLLSSKYLHGRWIVQMIYFLLSLSIEQGRY